jgi:uncharacterized protein (TIGR02444 family)
LLMRHVACWEYGAWLMDKGSDFWRFSLSFYRTQDVPAACISLQDRHGLDVNIMLFALWLASMGRAGFARQSQSG